MRCPYCFEISSTFSPCPYCGYDYRSLREGVYLPVGSSLHHGEYLIGKVLGKPGGFAITYLGWDTRLEVKVAIKEYLPFQIAGRASDHTSVSMHTEEYRADFAFGLEKFLEEAKILAQFRHPNIVRVQNFCRENGTAYMVMDYLEGESLAEYMERVGRVTGPDAVALLLPILDGLAHMHAKNLLHRDIKPANIYLTVEGLAILLDFGTARQAVQDRSQSLTAIVTHGFAPWEQHYRKGRQGPWTDVYACAATLYVMISGRVPPDGAERAIEDEIIPLGTLSPELDVATEKAITQALSVKIDERPQTAGEFKQLLQGRTGDFKEQVHHSVADHSAGKVKGALTLPNGDRYEGEISDGKPNGHGILTMPNGDRYEGEFVDGKKSGKGVLVSFDDYRYEGQFFNDCPSGEGVLSHPKGGSYSGCFLKGVPHGIGIETKPNGDRYEGNFVNGKKCGKGTYFFTKGSRWEGNWANDQRKGDGILYGSDGVIIKKGKWDGDTFSADVESNEIKNSEKSASFGKGIMGLLLIILLITLVAKLTAHFEINSKWIWISLAILIINIIKKIL